MLKRMRRGWRWLRKWPAYGERFKRYAPQNPAPESNGRLRVGICYLIPLLGDSILLFPLVDAIAREHPDAEVIGFVSGAGRILAMHPRVNRVYVQPQVPSVGFLWPVNVLVNQWRWWKSELRKVRLDVCIMPRGGFDPFCSAFLGWMLGGRERVGFTSEIEPERAETDMKPAPLLTREVKELRGIHEIQRGSDVLQLAGLIRAPIDPNSASDGLLAVATSIRARAFLSSTPELKAPYFIVAPGASLPRKRWPVESFIAVLEELRSCGWLPVLVGSADDEAACKAIEAGVRGHCLNLSGKTSVENLVALCAEARSFIGNDSGPAHIAGMCGVPTVVISSYASMSPLVNQTSPARIRPVGPWVTVVQPASPRPLCIDECISAEVHCIAGVTVDQVRKAVRELLIRSGRITPESFAG